LIQSWDSINSNLYYVTLEDHLRDVGAVLDQLHKNGIKVKVSKLQIGLKEIPFLGVVLRETGIIPNKEKTKAINDPITSNHRTAEEDNGYVRVLQKVHQRLQ